MTQQAATACVLCSMNCGIKVDVNANSELENITADDSNPISQGHICNKAYSLNHYVNHKQRLTGPLKRDDQGELGEVAWQQSFAEIGAKLEQIKQRYGGDKLAIAGLGGQGNHSDVLYGLAWLKSVQSPWFFSAYAQEKTQHHLVEQHMFASPPHSMMHPDPWHSDVLIIIGCNPLHSNRGYKSAENIRSFKKAGKALYVVDPRKTETARKADLHIAHKPGTDMWLFSAMVALIVQNQWYDQAYCRQWVDGLEQLQAQFGGLDIAALAAQCEVDVTALEQMTKAYAQADKGSLFWDTGVEWIPHTSLVSWLLRVLVVITGNYGRPGGNTLRPGFMADGEFLATKTSFIAPASQISGVPALGPFDMFSPNLLVDEINAGNIKALIVSSANPLRSYANSEQMRAAFAKLDLLVVIDTSLTETARQADYVLAAPSGYEKYEWSTFGRKFPKLTAHLRRPLIAPKGDVKTEAEIFTQIIKHSGGPASAPKWLKRSLGRIGWDNYAAAPLLLISALIAAKANPLQAFVRWVCWSYDAIGDSLPAKNVATLWLTCQLVALTRFRQFTHVPSKNPLKLARLWMRQILDNPNGNIVAQLPWQWHYDKALGHKDKKIRLLPALFSDLWQQKIHTQLETDTDYPLVLAAGERSPWTANTIQRDSSWRKGRNARCLLKINPATAAQLQLENDDWAKIITRSGEIKLQVKLDKAMREDNVSMPNGMGLEYPDENGELQAFGANTNDLTDYQSRDELTGIPFHKTVYCRVEKLA